MYNYKQYYFKYIRLLYVVKNTTICIQQQYLKRNLDLSNGAIPLDESMTSSLYRILGEYNYYFLFCLEKI